MRETGAAGVKPLHSGGGRAVPVVLCYLRGRRLIPS